MLSPASPPPFVVSVVSCTYFRHCCSYSRLGHAHTTVTFVTRYHMRRWSGPQCRRPRAGRKPGPPSSQSASEAQLHVGTCILAPALANATVRGARAAGVQGTARWWGVLRLPRDQPQRWRGTSDDAPHVRLHRHSAPGDLSVSRLEAPDVDHRLQLLRCDQLLRSRQ